MRDSLIYLNLFSALYYVVLIIYLVIQREKLYGSLSLIGIMVVNFYTLLNNSVILSGRGTEFAWVFWGSFLVVTLFGVFFRVHIYTLLRRKSRIDVLNSTVVILWTLGTYGAIQYYGLSSLEQEAYLAQILVRDFPGDFALMNDVFYLVLLAFFIESGIRAFKKPENLDKNYSNLFVQSTKYVRLFWGFILGMYLVVMSLSFVVEEFYIEYLAIPLSLNILFLFLVLNLRHYAINYAFEIDELEVSKREKPADELVDRIEAEVSKEENFRDPEFNLDRLSQRTDVSKNKISAAINQGLGIGFNDLLNANRIEFSKGILLNFDEKRDTIEGVGYSCGFNSKASFYRAFKKFTTLTPSEFMRLRQ